MGSSLLLRIPDSLITIAVELGMLGVARQIYLVAQVVKLFSLYSRCSLDRLTVYLNYTQHSDNLLFHWHSSRLRCTL